MSVQISLDVYPARVTLASGAVVDRARVFIANGDLLVYIMNNGTPTEYYKRAVISTEGSSPMSGINVQVEDGIVAVKKAGGCGCGSRLKTYNPWPGETRALVAL